jgi:hypothetical protein
MRTTCSILLIVAITLFATTLTSFGMVQNNISSQTSVPAASPTVTLQPGTKGTAIISTNSTNAQVNFAAPAPIPTYYPGSYSIQTGTYVSGSIPTSVQVVDNDYFVVGSAGTATSTTAYNPSGYGLVGSTTLVSGSVANLASDDGVYMTFRSYGSAYSYNTIQYDSANSTALGSSATSISWQHTTGTGSGRLLLVDVDIFNRGGTPTTVSSITYAGTNMNQVATDAYTTSGPEVRSYTYRLVNPVSGTNAVSVNFAASTLAVGGSITYSNVNQTNPVQTSNTSTGAGSSQSVSLTASGSENKTLYGHMSSDRQGGSGYSVTEDTAQTNRWAQTGYNYQGRTSEKTGGVSSGSQSMSWSTSKYVSWVAIAVLVEPSQAPSEFTSEVEFTGSSQTVVWIQLAWSIDSEWTLGSVSVTIQLYNYTLGGYPTSGSGYDSYNSSSTSNTNETRTQTITTNSNDFKDGSGNWKIKVKGVKTTPTQFDFKADWVEFKPTYYSQYTASTEFTFSNMTTNTPTQLNFTVVSQYYANVSVTIQVWNYSSSSYVTSGEGYLTYNSTGAANETKLLSINSNPQFYTLAGNAKINVTGVLSTTTQYQQKTNQIKLDYSYAASSSYDYVLKVVNQVASNWTVTLEVYSNSNINRLSNCTISFHDGSTSDQIIINGGAVTQSKGPQYTLLGSSTVYISVGNLQATMSGTSYLYVYLRILPSNTSPFNVLKISFQVT